MIVVSRPSASPPYPLSAEKLTGDRWHMAERGIRSEEEGGGGATPFLLKKTSLPLAGGLDREPRAIGGGWGGGWKRLGPQENDSPVAAPFEGE